MTIKNVGQDHVRYEVITQEDPITGDLLLPIPQTLLDSMDWKEGDEIDFSLDEEGRYILRKV
jgi:hypothetical protein